MTWDHMEAPDIGTIVEYGLDSFGEKPATWRVKSWMREAPTPQFKDETFADVIDEILFEGCQKIKGKRWQWCLQKEATHVSLTGTCGAIAPINECKVIGFVDWDEETVESERKHALWLGESHEMLF